LVGKKRIDNPGENTEVLQQPSLSVQNVVQEQNNAPKQLLEGNNANV